MENLDIVYLFGFSPRYGKELDRLLPILKSQVNQNLNLGLVLIHDGVIGALEKGVVPESVKKLTGMSLNLYVMKADLDARGISSDLIFKTVKKIEYLELVDVIEGSKKVVSWM